MRKQFKTFNGKRYGYLGTWNKVVATRQAEHLRSKGNKARVVAEYGGYSVYGRG